MSGFWRDPDFQTKLVAFICRDKSFLRECAHLLEPDDFKPRKPGDPMEIWIVASKGLEYYKRYREPIGGMLRTEILDHCRKTNAGERTKARMLDLVARIKEGDGLVAVDALAEKVIEYKKERLKKLAIQELVDLQEQGKLTDERWTEKCYQALQTFGKLNYQSTDYFETLEDRILRREKFDNPRRHPYFLIDPLDELIKGPGKGILAIWFAYLGMGKSLALLWTAMAYALQGLDVLFFTLEDPQEEVENRLDASIASLKPVDLAEKSHTLRVRFTRFLRLIRTRFKIVDGTEGGFTVSRIEEIWDRERNRGFKADAIFIDYDDEIKPERKHDERRFELADIYRDLRQLAGRRDIIVWSAAQTKRETEGMKTIATSKTAEDISKARKARIMIGIGQGDWGDNSRYIYVAKNNFGRAKIGRNIMGDFDRTIFYDRVKTIQAIDEERERKKKESIEEE